ncbi:30S ribosome-binding factor RbfA [Hyphococcus flavus]|uniref:Ribosome-binding factor A n=1 Tax=Hyphococcus flavus TaxID=1866326 RepID=A0AAF0CFN8_9PROT|nr:30S ribosome-binding factor RbfA [Hyphococcus flavus]WDI32651.1 30S ribosome-binding factor RbfA [Hyphococcus flavus]
MAKRFSKTKGPSQRQLRAGELVRHALVEILQREPLRDPALDGVSVTVSEVRVSPDLKQASIYAAPLGGTAQDDVVSALNRVAPYLRSLLGKKIDMKFTPALTFKSDDTFEEARKIDALLARPDVARDLKDRDD